MAYDLSKVKKAKPRIGQRWIIYGEPGMGKTSLAVSFPKVLLLDLEEGLPQDAKRVDQQVIKSAEDLFGWIDALQEQDHSYKTVVIDSLGMVEHFFMEDIKAKHKITDLRDAGWGKAYNELKVYFRTMLDDLTSICREQGMQVILIGHTEVANIDSPLHGSYDKISLGLGKTGKKIVEAATDIILFLDEDITTKKEVGDFGKETKRAIGDTKKRWLNCSKNPAYTAKNRIGLPEKLEFKKNEGYKALKPYIDNLSAG